MVEPTMDPVVWLRKQLWSSPALVDGLMFPHFGGVASFDSSCP